MCADRINLISVKNVRLFDTINGPTAVLSLVSDDIDPMLPVFPTQPQDQESMHKASKGTAVAEGGLFSDTSISK